MPEIGGFGDPEKGWYWMGRTLPDLPAMQAAHDALAKLLKSRVSRSSMSGMRPRAG